MYTVLHFPGCFIVLSFPLILRIARKQERGRFKLILKGYQIIADHALFIKVWNFNALLMKLI